jgi:hypothetical protein
MTVFTELSKSSLNRCVFGRNIGKALSESVFDSFVLKLNFSVAELKELDVDEGVGAIPAYSIVFNGYITPFFVTL